MSRRSWFRAPATLIFVLRAVASAPTVARSAPAEPPAAATAPASQPRATPTPRPAPPRRPSPTPAPALADSPEDPFELPDEPKANGRIDELVFARLTALGVAPAHGCTDAVFVRRAYLDLIGTLPTAAETRRFLSDPSAQKRAALIDRLLERPEFADYWATKWCDLLRVKAEFPINLWPNAAQEYHRWIYTAVRDNLPYDQFVRTQLTATGSNFRAGPVNFFRAAQARDPQGLARVTALTWMGTRFDHWTPAQRSGFAPFFSAVGFKTTQEWKEEIVYFDPAKLAAGGVPATFPDGTTTTLQPARDPRTVFADWLIRPENPWFTRAIVNRVWCWLLGRGIVHEPDDLRDDNPPANPELLRYLEQRFVAGHYDFKQLLREICNSQTYQLSSLGRSDRREAEANFASYPLRRLDAEVLIDALNQITGTTENYSSPIPEPFTYIPEDQRSIALPDGSISSSFLEMFGRPSRDTGEESERNNRITATQRLHLLNSTHIQRKIEQGPKLQALLRARRPASETLTELYLTVLSRPPTAAERAAIVAYAATAADNRRAGLDIAWALLNSAEFLYRH